jgi:hypothetical protein
MLIIQNAPIHFRQKLFCIPHELLVNREKVPSMQTYNTLLMFRPHELQKRIPSVLLCQKQQIFIYQNDYKLQLL